MSRADYRTWIGYTEYKPGYKIYVECETVTIEAVAALHRDGSGATIRIAKTIGLLEAENFNEEEFFGWLLEYLIMPFEKHEAQEWLKFRGKRVFEPHDTPNA